MRTLTQTKTTVKESASKILVMEKLTDEQKELMKNAVGQGLWEQILEGKPLPASVIELIRAKMRYRGLLPLSKWREYETLLNRDWR